MTKDKAFKRKIRRHAHAAGVRYTSARRSLLNKDKEQSVATQEATAIRCSFCGKTQHEVAKLIAGPGVYICDECVELSVAVLVVEQQPTLILPTNEELEERVQAMVPAIVAAADRMRAITTESVKRQLAGGASWADVAQRLRMSEEQAQRTFGDIPGDTPSG